MIKRYIYYRYFIRYCFILSRFCVFLNCWLFLGKKCSVYICKNCCLLHDIIAFQMKWSSCIYRFTFLRLSPAISIHRQHFSTPIANMLPISPAWHWTENLVTIINMQSLCGHMFPIDVQSFEDSLNTPFHCYFTLYGLLHT